VQHTCGRTRPTRASDKATSWIEATHR